MTEQTIIYHLLQIAENETGFTWNNYNPVKHDTGYQYSITPNTADNNTSDIAAAAAMVKKLKGSCGAWYSGGRWYIESSIYEPDLETALKAAAAAAQLTIYDWKNDRYITVNQHAQNTNILS